MTRMECKNIVDKHYDIFYNEPLMGRGVIPVAVFLRSPVSGTVECRQAFFIEALEADTWSSDITKFYKEHNIPYASYIGGKLDDSSDTSIFDD